MSKCANPDCTRPAASGEDYCCIPCECIHDETIAKLPDPELNHTITCNSKFHNSPHESDGDNLP